MKVTVIGGGIAGLTAAWTLSNAGAEVVLLDASHRIGGRMGSQPWKDRVIDCGAQFFFNGYQIIPRLLADVGLEDRLAWISPYSGVINHGRVFRLNICRPWSMMTSGLLSSLGSCRFLSALPRLAKEVRSLPPSDLTAWTGFEALHGDAEAWSHELFGPQVAALFLEPLLRSLCFQSLQGTSSTLMAAILSFARHRSRLLVLRGGVGALTQAIAKRFPCQLGCHVQAVHPAHHGVEIVLQSGHTMSSDYAIIATSASDASQLWQPDDEPARCLLQAQYTTTIQIALHCRSDWRPARTLRGLYGVLFPRSESSLLAALSFESNRYNDEGTSGELITLMLDDAPARGMIHLSDDELVSLAVREAERFIPGLERTLDGALVIRWAEAVPRAVPGRAKTLALWREGIDPASRVLLAGDYMNFPWSDGAATSGKWAADWILRSSLGGS